MTDLAFSNEELARYSRQLLLPEVGPEGQRKIGSASVLCVGAGGLGSPVLLYLAAAGIGRLGVVDCDAVDESNLQRQVLHTTGDVGRRKTDSARETLTALNPNVDVVCHDVRLSKDNSLEIISAYDAVVDGSDNFSTRYLTNDACVFLRKPNIYGAIFRFEGQASVFAPHLGGPCYRCLYPEPPPPGVAPSCAQAGVLGVVPGIVGCIQAAEVLKLTLGQGVSLMGRLLLFNALDMSFRELKVRRDPKCAVCGEHPTITALAEYDLTCASMPFRQSQPSESPDEVSVQDLKRALDNPASGIQALDVRELDEWRRSSVAGMRHLPLSSLQQRLRELDRERTYYICCKSGMRSRKAVDFLKSHGFSSVKSVRGGLLAWCEEIDRSMPKP